MVLKTKWRRMVKKFTALIRGKTSKKFCGFYCLKCRHIFRTNSKPESHRKYAEINTFVML